MKLETAIKGIKAKAAAIVGQTIEATDIGEAFDVTIDDDATRYELTLKIDGKDAATWQV
ncbi:hypothetical protein NHH03_21140 [Stieleria sp. TO1_6]|uniref:hypothetical protein n=1 Tax=Stieleria tagensis TaxID=2956795 RepID=UPI00209A69F5|nr:hypothetical protein [Stieleria tagensis]MCO8124262.1 hypothetical protein [Stieleria tagensis]